MSRKTFLWLIPAIALGGLLFFKYDSIRWRMAQLRGWVLDTAHPSGDTLPTPVMDAATRVAAASPASVNPAFDSALPTATPFRKPTVSPTPIPLVTPPAAVTLTGAKWEKQDINNCGPATLAMYLSFYGWPGTQKDVAAVLHPNERDKNVRWDELVYYVNTHAGWLGALFRVGGTVDEMKAFIANGFPVVIETGYQVDAGWVGHYLLLTGYDDARGIFIVQDATGGPDRKVPYDQMDKQWQEFNRLYILVYRPEKTDAITALLGPNADEAANRRRALATAEAESQSQPDNPYAWFNFGSNLNYFDRYAEAATAFDKARDLGLPKRMLFYQFGPYRAYFNVGRYQDVIDLSTFTLDYRPDLEESYFWRGWAEYMLGDRNGAATDFRNALDVNPTFNDAKTALGSIGAGP